jgi:hypothetical protein
MKATRRWRASSPAASTWPYTWPASSRSGYLAGEFEIRHQSALARLGPHKAGKGCLYIKRLGEVDQDALRELIDRSARVRKGIGQASG